MILPHFLFNPGFITPTIQHPLHSLTPNLIQNIRGKKKNVVSKDAPNAKEEDMHLKIAILLKVFQRVTHSMERTSAKDTIRRPLIFTAIA